MANPLKGEVELVVVDSETDAETIYIMRLSIDAIVHAETVLDKGINDMLPTLDRIGTLRALLWASLLEHHPEVLLLDAGELIVAAGADVVMGKIAEALKAAFPEQKAGTARPRTAAKSGTGKAS